MACSCETPIGVLIRSSIAHASTVWSSAGDAFAKRRHRGGWVYSPSLATVGVAHPSVVRRGPSRAAFPAPCRAVGARFFLTSSASLEPLPAAQCGAHRSNRNPVRAIGYPLPVVTQWSSTAPMICREFRDLHPALLDDTLTAHDVVEMQLHLATCVRCSRYDTAIRRGLMVLRNLPALEPSADFLDRLNQKLLAAQKVDARAEHYRGPGV